MILPEFPSFDDAGPRRRKSSSRRRLALAALLSGWAHFATYGGYCLAILVITWLGYTPPHLLTRSQRASIELQASIAAAPQPDETEAPVQPVRVEPPKPREQPAPKIAQVTEPTLREDAKMPTPPTEAVATAAEVPEPKMERTEPPVEEVPPPDQKIEEPRRVRSKTLATVVAPVESVESAASVAVEGAQFDEPPQPDIYNRKPPYPADARARRLQGVVLLRLTISAAGAVEDAVIVESSGVRSFDDSARRTALQWRFTPARLLGMNVMVVMEHVVRFTFRDAT